MALFLNYPQQGIVDLAANDIYDALQPQQETVFNTDKSSVSGGLTITPLSQTHGRSVDAVIFNHQVQA
jgi:hypothetical protein